MREVYLEGGQDLVFKEAQLDGEALTFSDFQQCQKLATIISKSLTGRTLKIGTHTAITCSPKKNVG